MTSLPEVVPGSIIDGRYRITGVLGEGGVGTVYRAEQLNLKRTVALKVLAPRYAVEAEHKRRFEREARVAARLCHRAAVEIYDVGIDRGIPFMAMELLKGCELRDLITDGLPLLPGDVVTIARTMAEVLAEAHAIPLVHRDIKPENIFILGGQIAADAIKVVDFGLAFIAGGDELGRMTQEGQVVGTPAYLSPEQAMCRPIGPASDIYSLGCVLYEVATGWPPFLGSWVNVVTQHLHVTATPPRERAPDAGLPGDLDALIVSMMAKDPDDRPTTGEVVSALASVAETLAGARHRGRSDELLADRRQRMISVPSIVRSSPSRPIAVDAEIVLGFIGGTSDELAIALATNGMGVVAVDLDRDLPPGVDVLVVRESSVGTLERAAALGLPVVAVVGQEHLERISQLLRIGVSDVVPQPARLEDVVRKVRRALAKHRRRTARI